MILYFSLLLFCTGQSNACPYAKVHPTSFDENEFIFIGQVREYVGPKEATGVVGKIWGLKVEIRDIVHVPVSHLKRVELYPFDVSASCDPAGIDFNWLSQLYPVNSVIRVVAKRSKHFTDTTVVQLEAWDLNNGSVSRKLSSDVKNFDYQRYVSGYSEVQRSLKTQMKKRADFIVHWESYKKRIDFEVRRDLLRFKKAKSAKEQYRILEAFACDPYIRDQSFSELVDNHVQSAGQHQKLMTLRSKTMSTFRQN